METVVWDDPYYKPTPDELDEPITIDADPEDVGAALMRPKKAIPSYSPALGHLPI